MLIDRLTILTLGVIEIKMLVMICRQCHSKSSSVDFDAIVVNFTISLLSFEECWGGRKW